MIADVLSGSARWCVVHGENADVLPTIPTGSVHHVITDPPYSEHVHSKSRTVSRKQPLFDGNGRLSRCCMVCEVDFGFPPITPTEMVAVSIQAARLATRWVLAFCDVESSHLWSDALCAAGLDYCRTGLWIKIGATPQFTGDRPAVGAEAIVVCHPKGRKRWNGGGKAGVWSHRTCIERGGKSTENDSREHPTQKPLRLMVDLVRDFTDPNDIVLDPYCGSGTTGVACVRLGRRFIGIERDPRWAEIARRRIEAEERGTTTKAIERGQLPLLGRMET